VRFGDGDPDGAVAALTGHVNPDGGFGWGLEPDLRSETSQPGGALHAFEVLQEIGPATSPLGVRLCDWLQSVSLPDGGLPFALAGAAGPGTAPFWGGADHARSSLHITSAVSAMAHRVAEHDRAVADHPWLARATDYCMVNIAALREPGHAIAFQYVLGLLDALHDRRPDAPAELARMGAFLPESGAMHVAGGIEDEQIRPLDFSPLPGRPLRELFSSEVIERDLDRLAAEQLEDGGWEVDFRSYSAAAALEWRGYATVRALMVLEANGHLER
jgi:hypothetical protein